MMRAKMLVKNVKITRNDANEVTSEELFMMPVGPRGSYPPDGSDENNSYARWSPSGDLRLVVANPALFGKIQEGQEFYLDFTAIKKLEEWQERLIKEKAELDERLEGVTKYISGDGFKSLPEDQQTLITRQKKAMTAYSKTLADRIAKF
jgi:hypothetical protein